MRNPPPNLTVDVNTLDSNERFIVAELGVDALAWFRFRYAIAVGTNADVLTSTLIPAVPIPDDLRSLYCDFGRNHYDAICSLGAAKLYQKSAKFMASAPPLHVHTHLKGFYHSLGCCLDALSRIIYTLSYADALTRRPGNPPDWRWYRHKVDWTELRRLAPAAFSASLTNAVMKDVQTVRNTLTHGWMPQASADAATRKLSWPDHVCTARDIPWANDPADLLAAAGGGNLILIDDLVAKHFDATSDVVAAVFTEGVNQIPAFEGFHNIVIV